MHAPITWALSILALHSQLSWASPMYDPTHEKNRPNGWKNPNAWEPPFARPPIVKPRGYQNVSTADAIHGRKGFRNVAYFLSWGVYGGYFGFSRDYHPQQLPASDLTHLIYSYATVDTNGTVFLSDPYADTVMESVFDQGEKRPGVQLYGSLKELFILKKQNRNFKTLLSIGGWNWSKNFAAAASTQENRQTFADSVVTLVKDLGFDGIDLDWEYPASIEDASNYASLVTTCRKGLDTYSQAHADGYHFLITATTPAATESISHLSLSELDQHLDFYNLMAYDYAGGWNSVTGHQANVYPSVATPQASHFSTDKAITDYLAAGIEPRKLNLGIPLYGRVFKEVTVGAGLRASDHLDNGLGMPFLFTGMEGDLEKGVWSYKQLPRNDSTEFYDEQAIAAWSWDRQKREVITYDTKASVEGKMAYAKEKGLGGAMFWEISGDKSGDSSLVGVVKNTVGASGLEYQENLLQYPESRYENLRLGSIA